MKTKDGYLIDHNDYSEEWLLSVIPDITPQQRQIVNAARRYYKEKHCAPLFQALARYIPMDRKKIASLFPTAPAKIIARAAGLPAPTGCG